MIAALFVEKGGVYAGLPDVDLWDVSRDARQYPGPWPVVAHPPCARWCGLAGLVEHVYGYKAGEDGGCFEAALRAVRTWGGVLEHPAYSRAFAAFGLPAPRHGRWARSIDGGWSCQISQRAYGHPARKATWLYAVGITALPAMNWARPRPIAQVSFLSNRWDSGLPKLRSKHGSATPPAFRDLLLGIAANSIRPAVSS